MSNWEDGSIHYAHPRITKFSSSDSEIDNLYRQIRELKEQVEEKDRLREYWQNQWTETYEELFQLQKSLRELV